MNISRHVEDLECWFLVLATKEKSKCISLDNVLKHSHLKNIVLIDMIVMMWNCWFQKCDTCQTRSDDDGGDGDDDDAKLLVSQMRHLSKRAWINGSPTPPQ